ncbi:MAG: single-stranded DNA-binding protein [Culicoidibacterales bacterium]
MNQTQLLGRVTRDIELKAVGATQIASFSLAVKRSFKDKKTGQYESDFLNCKAFGKTAEILANHVKKGNQLAVNGSIQTGKYENKDGNTIYTTDIIVNGFTFISEAKPEQTAPQPQFNQMLDDSEMPF